MLVIIALILLLGLTIAISTRPEIIKLKNYSPINTRVVCSLTTRPVQPKYFNKVLDRLVEQFDAVYLALPKVSCDGITYPEISHSGVTVIPVEEDYGPITKFFGILNSSEKSDTLVVVLDDDIIYSPKLRDIYQKNSVKYPRCVLTGAGIVYRHKNIELPWFLCMTGRREYFPIAVPSFLGNMNLTTVAGYSGICFRRNLIQRKALLSFIRYWNQNKECFLNDDIVISAFFSIKGIPRIAVQVPRNTIPDKDTPSLSITGAAKQGGTLPMQHRVLKHLRDCFRNDPVRFDCICLFDIIMVALVVASLIIIWKFSTKCIVCMSKSPRCISTR